MTPRTLSGNNISRRGHSARAAIRETNMEFKYALNTGATFLLSATDMADLLDVMYGRGKDCRDGVLVHRADDLVRQLERGLTDLEGEIELSLNEIRARRASRDLENDLADDLVGWEPADD